MKHRNASLLREYIHFALHSEYSVREDLLRLLQEERMVADAGGVVTYNELAGMCLEGDGSSLLCSGVHSRLASECVLLDVGGLVEERIDPFYLGNDGFLVLRVRAVGVTFACLVVELAGILVETAVMLVEEETAGGDFVLERYGLNCDGAVGEDDCFASRVNRMEDDLVLHIAEVVVHLRMEQFFKVRMRIDMQRLGPSEHIEGGEQTEQTKAVVAVEVGYEDGIQARCLEVHLPHRQLDAFAAVDKELLVAQLKYLSGRRVLKSRQRASRTQYGEVCFHLLLPPQQIDSAFLLVFHAVCTDCFHNVDVCAFGGGSSVNRPVPTA